MRVIFLDVDGTLCNYDSVIPDSAVEAIRAARAKGNLVYLCTGRSRSEINPDLWAIGVDGLIGGNGSYVEHQEQVLMHQLISEKDSHDVVDWLHERGLEFFLESNNGLFASENFETVGQPVVQAYVAGKGATDVSHLTVREVMPDLTFGGELYRNDLNKISFILSDYQDYVDAAAAFPQLKAGTWGGKGAAALFGDLGVANISKATAMKTVLEHVGVPVADSVAFGDAVVDIPMFEFAGTGVAMGNASQEAQDAADWVTAPVEDDGLHKAFEKLGLI